MFLTKEQLEKLTTKRLLAYKNKLMKYPETKNWDDPNGRMSKEHQVWKNAYQDLKDVLSTRENIEK